MFGPADAVVVLAAGLSRRFGADDKLLADFRGRPLASYCATTLSIMALGSRIAVCRDDPAVARIFSDLGFSIITNENSAQGQASSLALGAEAAQRAGARSVLVCLADMPLVSVAHLDALGRGLEQSPSGIAASVGSPGAPPMPPAAFAARHFKALMQLTGDRGARPLLAEANLVVAPPGELADFDTPGDFSASA